uniref:Uncharacterized protein n=1 Tax=Nelumbo nucifera TaxID=4432 RepID=A0A822ZRE2_NELNU|nr:TPA_asm: hypothetical protein HUJ06_017749 [Nelumbo nucifera]
MSAVRHDSRRSSPPSADEVTLASPETLNSGPQQPKLTPLEMR